MTPAELTVAIAIHLLVPMTGLGFFIALVRKMKLVNLSKPPVIHLFIVFAVYGGLLMVTLTSLLWKWSALASLGTFFLILIAPILMGFIAYTLRVRKKEDPFHRSIYFAAVSYFPIAPACFIVLYLIGA